jgi:beta-glucanase (GH16 family)
MRMSALRLAAVVVFGTIVGGCSNGPTGTSASATVSPSPTITITAAQNGAVIVSLASGAAGETILYTIDGSTPKANSSTTIPYLAPFLVASNLTVKAIATTASNAASAVVSRTFASNIASGTLVWSDEFTSAAGANTPANPQVWTYDTGTNCCGNSEWEDYCAAGSATAPCSPASPNSYVGTDGYLHIVAEHTSAGVYAPGAFTSARLKTQGLFSFQYGRIEAKILQPESQGMWPAFWLLGNNIVNVNWPACGELDVMEHVDGSNPLNEGFDWVKGSVHGTNLNDGTQYHPTGFSAAGWHTYGMIWTPGQVQFYVDDATKPYATFTPSTVTGTWPFDAGPQYILLNLAVGGSWPGAPDATSVFPADMKVDYVRVYTN